MPTARPHTSAVCPAQRIESVHGHLHHVARCGGSRQAPAGRGILVHQVHNAIERLGITRTEQAAVDKRDDPAAIGKYTRPW